MSRSRRKSPCHGITNCRSEKLYKRHANRKLRKLNRQRLAVGEFEAASIYAVSNVWAFGKDGKSWWIPDIEDDDEMEAHQRMLRK